MPELDKMKKGKNSVKHTLNACISVICALWVAGCATSLPSRQVPSELDVTQVPGSDPHPAEYVFCDMNGGAWGCKSVTPKTPVFEASADEATDGAVNTAVKVVLKELSGAQGEATQPAGKPGMNTHKKGGDLMPGPKTSTRAGSVSSLESVPSNATQIATVLFDFNSSLLTADAKIVLLDVLQKLNGGSLLIRGYTDNIGPSEYNDWLALRRANKVREFFETARANVERIEVEGFGLCCYVESNDSPEKRAKNRRVEIYMVD